MGVVHLAQAPNGARVALKVLRPHIVGDDESRERLAREGASLQRVRSPWVAEVIDADPWGTLPYVATRYVPGFSLHEHVRRYGPLTGSDLRLFAAGLAEAVIAVHQVGVLHRDIKPSNVLLEGRTPVLIDFGLARLAEDPRLTQTGWFLGTPGYLAPEILYGDDATTASDAHSWAATVAFAATGRPPFGTGPAVAIMDRVRRGEHDLSDVRHPIRALLEECLASEPADRPEMAAVLATLRAAAPAHASRPTPVDQPTMPFALFAAPDPTEDEERDPAEARTSTLGATPGDDRGTEVIPAVPLAPQADRWPRQPPAASSPTPTAVQPTLEPTPTTRQPTPTRTIPVEPEPAPERGPARGARQPYMQPPPPQDTRRVVPGPVPQTSYPTPRQPPLASGVQRLQRGLLLLGLFGLVAVGFAMAPYLSLLALAVVALAVRTFSWTSDSMRARRDRRGR